MIRGVAGVARWILVLVPALTSRADGLNLVSGPPANGWRDFWMTVAAFGIGFVGLVVLRRRRYFLTKWEMPPPAGKERLLRVVFWLLLIGVPFVWVLRESLVSVEHNKVTRTKSYVRQIAAAWEKRATDVRQYNAAGAGMTYVARNEKEPTAFAHTITAEQLAHLLVPKYMASFPMRDAWGNEWLLALDQPYPGTPGAVAESYVVASPGRDGRFEPRIDGNESCDAWECDIVFSNGNWIVPWATYDGHDD